MKLSDCHNFHDFRKLARQNLPSPIFNYIDGAADDEITYKRNTESFNDVDLVPNVLAGVEDIDLSTTIFEKKIDLPLYLAPTAVQRLFHYDGERAVAKAAEKFNTMFGISSLATVSAEEISSKPFLQQLVDVAYAFSGNIGVIMQGKRADFSTEICGYGHVSRTQRIRSAGQGEVLRTSTALLLDNNTLHAKLFFFARRSPRNPGNGIRSLWPTNLQRSTR